jgi:hypothetical protein
MKADVRALRGISHNGLLEAIRCSREPFLVKFYVPMAAVRTKHQLAAVAPRSAFVVLLKS